jgi:hypothetical protein
MSGPEANGAQIRTARARDAGTGRQELATEASSASAPMAKTRVGRVGDERQSEGLAHRTV